MTTRISAKIVEASISEVGKAITTYQLTYHRYVHGELMTHRAFSRNASSSRAIPVSKMLAQVWNDPAVPIHWGKNQPGMQAHSQLSGFKRKAAEALWRVTGKLVCIPVYMMNKLGLAKQVANRLLEPWMWMHVVLTATEMDNWYELRDHVDAQPEIRELAICMRKADASVKRLPLKQGEWHLPYVTNTERYTETVEDCKKMSAARCARVSYLTHDGDFPDRRKDIALYERLVGSSPRHASPVEHQATPTGNAGTIYANFRGWKAFRFELEQAWFS